MLDRIEIIPLKGMLIGNIEVNFFDTEDSVIDKLGEPLAQNSNQNNRVDQLYYFENEVRFDFNCKTKELEFIEFLGGYDAKVNPLLYGHNVFSIEADDLINVIKKHDNGPVDRSEGESAYSFINSSIGVWRELTPTMYEEEIKDSDYDEECLEVFKKRVNHWETVGFGIKGYYDYLLERNK